MQNPELIRKTMSLTIHLNEAAMLNMRLGLLSACILCAGCAVVERTPVAQTGNRQEEATACEEILDRRKVHTPCFGDFAAHIRWVEQSEYTDERGEKKYGLAAGLDFIPSKMGNDSKSGHFTVHVGQRFEWEEYSIFVEEIGVRPGFLIGLFSQREHVRLRIRPMNQALH